MKFRKAKDAFLLLSQLTSEKHGMDWSQAEEGTVMRAACKKGPEGGSELEGYPFHPNLI